MILAESVVIPRVDPLGVPAHPALFVALLLLTQLLHLLLMNFVLGGGLLAAGLNIAGLRRNARAAVMSQILYRMMPVVLSMAITMGVAPLLFVQVLYGPHFYSANVLMGFSWFSFFIAVLLGFYLVYWLIHREPAPAGSAPPALRVVVSVAAAACFLYVGWIMANNHELSLRPALWRAGAHGGSRWYTPAATTLPRYLHDVVGAMAVAGLWLAAIGWWRRRRESETPETDTAFIRLGLKTASLATTLQIGVGVLFLLRLETPVRSTLLGFGSWLGGVWTLALLGAAALFVLLAIASARPEQFRWFALSAFTGVLVVIGMLIGREQVRLAHLALPEGGAFSIGQWPVYPQYASLIVFALLLVGTLGVVGLMIKWILQGTRESGTSEEAPYRHPIEEAEQTLQPTLTGRD